jgi:hypothetical protein
MELLGRCRYRALPVFPEPLSSKSQELGHLAPRLRGYLARRAAALSAPIAQGPTFRLKGGVFWRSHDGAYHLPFLLPSPKFLVLELQEALRHASMYTMIEMSHNQYMKRTRVAPVNVPKCASKCLALFELCRHRLRAAYLSP